jgi:hypothetical protein
MNASKTASILQEALGNYMGWEVELFNEPAFKHTEYPNIDEELVTQY